MKVTAVCGAKFDTMSAFVRHLPKCIRCAYAYARSGR